MTPLIEAVLEALKAGNELEKSLINAAKVLQYCKCQQYAAAAVQAKQAERASDAWRSACNRILVLARDVNAEEQKAGTVQ